jgi:hypothetical protein
MNLQQFKEAWNQTKRFTNNQDKAIEILTQHVQNTDKQIKQQNRKS